MRLRAHIALPLAASAEGAIWFIRLWTGRSSACRGDGGVGGARKRLSGAVLRWLCRVCWVKSDKLLSAREGDIEKRV